MEIRIFLEMNNNQNAVYQKLWSVAETVVKDKFIALNAYIKNKWNKETELSIQFKKSGWKTSSLNKLKKDETEIDEIEIKVAN